MLELFAILLVVVIIWYVQYHVSRRRLYKLAAQFDGPKSLPLIGNILYALTPLTDINQSILAGCLHYNSPIRLWIGSHLAIAIWDPENVKIVLNNSDALTKQPQMYKSFEMMVGTGLVTLPVGEWKRHRKLIAPAFKNKYIESLFDIVLTHARELVGRVQTKVDQGVFDVCDILCKFALDNVVDAMLDVTDATENSPKPVDSVQVNKRIMHGIVVKLTTLSYYSDFIYNLSAAGKQMRADIRDHNNHIVYLIKKWKERHFNNDLSSERNTIIKTESFSPYTLMDKVYSTSSRKGQLTMEELHDEVKTIISAGSETTAAVLGYALMLLAIHQDIQEKVLQEIIQAKGIKEELEFEDLKNLKLVERVIKETLRLFPPAPNLARYTAQEIRLTNHVIPANSTIVIGIIGLHHDPNIWPNPNTFEPDRFLPEEEAKRHPYSWIPFSAGPRNCIGLRLAIFTLKIALSTFILNYKVKTDYRSVDDIHLDVVPALKPTDGYKISIKSR